MAIDVGNAGTLLRLLPGWLAGQDGGSWTLDGDESIRRRPVDRVAAPLAAMGAQLDARDGRFTPLAITGRRLHGAEYVLPVASAQIKSCVLLAGLLADGATTVVEPEPSRDHTERLLARAGAGIARDGDRVTVTCQDELELDAIHVPGDPSSAAFHVAAAVLVPGSRLVVEGMAANWTRVGFFRILERMGAVVIGDLEAREDAAPDAEPLCELDVAHGPLVGTRVTADEVPLAIDELPLVALLGCFAEGETVVEGAQELRVKESDRIATVVDGPARPGRRHRGDRGRLRRARHRRAARRHDPRPRRPPARDARRGRGARQPRGRRGRRDGGRGGLLPGLHGRSGRADQLASLTPWSSPSTAPPGPESPPWPGPSPIAWATPTSTPGRCTAAWRCS